MNPRLLISLLTAVFGTHHATATPFARYDNEATRALTAEAAAIGSPQRISVGDNPAKIGKSTRLNSSHPLLSRMPSSA